MGGRVSGGGFWGTWGEGGEYEEECPWDVEVGAVELVDEEDEDGGDDEG